MPPSLVLATLCLNEMEWLPKLYEQHKDWPGLAAWIFVEGADRMYAAANPELVNALGLSVDGTSEYLTSLAKIDSRVIYRPYGLGAHASGDPAQGKVVLRNQYAIAADSINPDYLLVVDADEFYCKSDQPHIVEYMVKGSAIDGMYGFCFRQREIWRPPSIADDPLFNLEVKHALWNQTHSRGWKWQKGLRYFNDHNHLEMAAGTYTTRGSLVRYDNDPAAPQYIHLGFASKGQMRLAKNKYYVARGEGVDDGRDKFVTCRDVFRVWEPGMRMPHRSCVVTYQGPIPECFTECLQ